MIIDKNDSCMSSGGVKSTCERGYRSIPRLERAVKSRTMVQTALALTIKDGVM